LEGFFSTLHGIVGNLRRLLQADDSKLCRLFVPPPPPTPPPPLGLIIGGVPRSLSLRARLLPDPEGVFFRTFTFGPGFGLGAVSAERNSALTRRNRSAIPRYRGHSVMKGEWADGLGDTHQTSVQNFEHARSKGAAGKSSSDPHSLLFSGSITRSPLTARLGRIGQSLFLVGVFLLQLRAQKLVRARTPFLMKQLPSYTEGKLRKAAAWRRNSARRHPDSSRSAVHPGGDTAKDKTLKQPLHGASG